MYKWMTGNTFNKVATIYPGNITLNTPCIDFFDNAKWCAIGIDEKNKKVGIKILSLDDIKNKNFTEDKINKISIGKSFVRVSNKSVIKEIEKIINKKIECEKFEVNFNNRERILEIELNQLD